MLPWLSCFLFDLSEDPLHLEELLNSFRTSVWFSYPRVYNITNLKMPCMPVVKVVKRKHQYFLTCLQFFKAGKANSVGLHLLVSQRRVVRATKTAEKKILLNGARFKTSHMSQEKYGRLMVWVCSVI